MTTTMATHSRARHAVVDDAADEYYESANRTQIEGTL